MSELHIVKSLTPNGVEHPWRITLMLPGEPDFEHVIHLPVDPSDTDIRVALRPQLTAEDLVHALVYGRSYRLKCRDMFIDAQAEAKGLEYNESATMCRQAYLLRLGGGFGPGHPPIIRGPAAVFALRIRWAGLSINNP